MSIQYYVKALWAGTIAFLGPISGGLLVSDMIGFGDLSAGVWISAVVLGLVGFGGVLGWQATPASVSTSVRP